MAKLPAKTSDSNPIKVWIKPPIKSPAIAASVDTTKNNNNPNKTSFIVFTSSPFLLFIAIFFKHFSASFQYLPYASISTFYRHFSPTFFKKSFYMLIKQS